MRRITVLSALYLGVMLYLSGCSTVEHAAEPAAAPPPLEQPAPEIQSAPVMHEGGIVGTGNNPDCDRNKKQKDCPEQLP